MNTSNIPASVILEQSQNYTQRQMRFLYEDNIDLQPSVRVAIKNLYAKAEKLEDNFTMSILESKYDLISIFERDISGLTQVSKESTEMAFKEIFQFIKKINPYDDETIINRRAYHITKCTKKPRNRVYGSISFRTCFKKTEDGVIFSIKSYLYKANHETLDMLLTSLICPKDVLTKVFPEKIEWCLQQKRLEKELLMVLRMFPGPFPIPLEDIVDMENGKIKMVKVSINEVR